jgi:Flp pilus assembly protein TadG/uncharacterized protein YegL
VIPEQLEATMFGIDLASIRRTGQSLRRGAAAILENRAGNFTLSFALVAVPMMVAIGSSLDYVQAMNMHRKLQSDLDAALVAAVQSIDVKDETALKAEIANWLEAKSESSGLYTLDADGVDIDTSGSTITATANASVDTTFLKIAGIDTIPVSLSSSVLGGKNATSKNAFSMYLVLDRSGSMEDNTNTTYSTICYNKYKVAYNRTKYYTKIESLKLAANDLMTQLATADPDKKYVRTGAVSYNIEMQDPTDLAWGESAVVTYVNALTATGGTNSGDAFKTAYKAVSATSETNVHKSVNGQTPAKYIVFMTDGDNNDTSYDKTTKKWCDKARNDNVTVYTVAFMAPTRGQELLQYCATTSDDYFSADNTAELVAAFKLIGETASKTMVRITK